MLVRTGSLIKIANIRSYSRISLDLTVQIGLIITGAVRFRALEGSDRLLLEILGERLTLGSSGRARLMDLGVWLSGGAS